MVNLDVLDFADIILISREGKEFTLKRKHALELHILKAIIGYVELHYGSIDAYVIHTKLQ